MAHSVCKFCFFKDWDILTRDKSDKSRTVLDIQELIETDTSTIIWEDEAVASYKNSNSQIQCMESYTYLYT